MMKLGHVVINVVILLGMSGPKMNCPGYEPNDEVGCTTDCDVLKRVDPRILNPNVTSMLCGNSSLTYNATDLFENATSDWCHEQCANATLKWDLPIPYFALSSCLVITASLPLHVRLKEDRTTPLEPNKFLLQFWGQIQRRATWQLILYGVISHTTFGVQNAAKPNANFTWLGLTAFQQQIMIAFEKIAFIVGIGLVRKYALHVSWRKMVMAGSLLVTIFNMLYFLIIFDVLRNTWFYMSSDVSSSFMLVLNQFVGLVCMVEIAEPGFEAITYAMMTAANNAVRTSAALQTMPWYVHGSNTR